MSNGQKPSQTQQPPPRPPKVDAPALRLALDSASPVLKTVEKKTK
ncbi:hypothetical protein F971_02570 [Acinetobacter vivianii]|uniref:Uncharacterized protein n=1 Tax=Acinetobacter vivianii TaxID=1776742 RepID=N8W3Q3_9GAMM|nr:hypothetical protein F971_02570 [Acinetobacter vivianii]